MEQFIVSARKYRPARFDSVVGQATITATLKRAIAQQQLAHAYLFCGPRGVGKTTCARIFAKTINCLNLGEDGEACDTCESCRQFNTGKSFNITELDAASNNSVDDIRQLVERVRTPPAIGRYSVFIIDEVHMLSQAAFNAFLKTLEEPPPYALFILATTEKHKILPTILSRCQIYDFHRIRVDDTINFLASIAEREGVESDREALSLIALKADGAMRDALSTFDQVVSFTASKVLYDQTLEALNLLDVHTYFRITESLLANRYVDALLELDDVLARGFDLGQFLSGLNGHVRNLLLASDAQTSRLLEIGEAFAAKYEEGAKGLDSARLSRMLMLLAEAQATLKQSANPRLHVELLLIALSESGDDEKKKDS